MTDTPSSGDLVPDSSTSYLGGVFGMPVIVATSALKHGVKEDDMLHAYRNPLRIWDLEDGFTMMIGASESTDILEIGVVQGDDALVIVHAMPAREKFLR